MKRTKIWLQRGDPEAVGIRRYLYTGWQWNIVPATADVASCPELLNVADEYDAWVQQEGYPKANHYIVTEYVDGTDLIIHPVGAVKANIKGCMKFWQ